MKMQSSFFICAMWKPDHNRMHAGDVLHGVYYLTSQAIPGFQMVPADPETPSASGNICTPVTPLLEILF